MQAGSGCSTNEPDGTRVPAISAKAGPPKTGGDTAAGSKSANAIRAGSTASPEPTPTRGLGRTG